MSLRVKKDCVWEKDYIWNPATCSSENSKHENFINYYCIIDSC